MPHALFWAYAAALGHTLAFDRIQHARAVGHAVALAFGSKDNGLPDSVRADMVDAYLLAKE